MEFRRSYIKTEAGCSQLCAFTLFDAFVELLAELLGGQRLSDGVHVGDQLVVGLLGLLGLLGPFGRGLLRLRRNLLLLRLRHFLIQLNDRYRVRRVLIGLLPAADSHVFGFLLLRLFV